MSTPSSIYTFQLPWVLNCKVALKKCTVEKRHINFWTTYMLLLTSGFSSGAGNSLYVSHPNNDET